MSTPAISEILPGQRRPASPEGEPDVAPGGPWSLREILSPIRAFPEIRTARAMLREAARNPYGQLAARQASRSRFKVPLIVMLAGAASFGIALSWNTREISPWAFVVLAYFPLRLVLIYRAGRLAANAGRAEIEAGRFEQACLTPMPRRDIVLGWALAGWRRCAGETAVALAILYPWFVRYGLLWAAVPIAEMIHLFLLQGLSAVIGAKCVHSFALRHEAASAGWASAAMTYPFVFFAQSLVLSLFVLFVAGFLVLVPVTAALLLQASGFSWIENWNFVTIFRAVFILVVTAYAFWLPLGVIREANRQLQPLHQDERFRRYFEKA